MAVKRLVIVASLIVAISSCNSVEFTGESRVSTSEKAPNAPVAPAVADATVQPASAVALPPIQSCKAKPSTYDPEVIDCSVGVGETNVWNSSTGYGWDVGSTSFVDRSANWISPLARTSFAGQVSCPSIMQNERLIYVTNINVTTDDTYTIEAMIDDNGSVQVWRDGDPSKSIANFAVVSNPTTQYFRRDLAVTAGSYTIIFTSQDSGAASAAIASVWRTSNPADVLRRTETKGSADWCIFRVAGDVDIATFVPDNASCRRCMTGRSK